jgi:hypothetical protein
MNQNPLTKQQFDNLIYINREIGKNHTDYATRLRIHMAATIIAYLDRTEPGWRDEALAIYNSTEDAQIEQFFDIVLGDVSLALAGTPIRFIHEKKEGE